MSISSHRMLTSRQREAINLTSSVISKRGRHFWICSQIHSRTIFFVVQILLIISSLAVLCSNLYEQSWHNVGLFFQKICAYATFFAAIAGIWALKLADKVYETGRRINKDYIIPPKFIIIPSYIMQIGCIIYLMCMIFHYLVVHVSYTKQPLSFLIFGVFFPISLLLLVILYVFTAEIDCFMYVINRSRYWRSSRYPPSLLNARTLNEKPLFESVLSRSCFPTTDILQEHERTKSGGSRKAFNDTQTRIEVISPSRAADDMEPFFSEFSRKGISMISSLDTVLEESSKSINSLP